MTLYYCGFGDEVTPLLVDAQDERSAKRLASEIAKGLEPMRVVAIPVGVFAAQLFVEDEEGNEIVVDPLEYVVDVLERIDELDVLEQIVEPCCGQEAEAADDEVVTCRLRPGHSDNHEGVTIAGDVVTWL